jgi:hypothetical protein
VRLRYRRGYSASTEADRFVDRTFAAAALGVTSNPLGIEVEVQEQQPKDSGRHVVPILVKVPLSRLSLLPKEAVHEGQLSILIAVRNPQGAVAEYQRRKYPVKIPHQQFFTALDDHAEFSLSLIMNDGDQRVAVGVRDEFGRVDTAVAVDVAVGGVEG